MGLDETERSVYAAMVREPALGVKELAAQLGVPESTVRGALDSLADRALLGDADHDQPVSPRIGLGRLLADEEAALRVRAEEVASLRAFMEQSAADFDERVSRHSIAHLTSVGEVRERLVYLAESATSQCLTINPGRSHTAEGLDAGKPLNEAALARGVILRSVYQDTFGNSPQTLAYAKWFTEVGGQLRVKPTLPMLLVAVDHEVVLVPAVADDPSQGALEIRTPSLVTALVALFDSVWDSAVPFGESRRSVGNDTRDPRADEALRLLAKGLTDEAVGKRLGMSGRSVRRAISDVMTTLHASSRFQAGVEAVRRGWLD